MCMLCYVSCTAGGVRKHRNTIKQLVSTCCHFDVRRCSVSCIQESYKSLKFLLYISLTTILLVNIVCVLLIPHLGVDYIGCIKETTPRFFGLSPGGYNPSTLTVATCRGACAAMLKNYAALTSSLTASYCFCSNAASLPAIEPDDSNCSVACLGDPLDFCGSPTHASVWQTPLPIKTIRLESFVDGLPALRCCCANGLSAELAIGWSPKEV